MTTERPLDWIREIDASLVELDEKPQFGLPAAFDWHSLEKEFRDLFGRYQLQVSHEVKGWVTSDQLWQGMGGKLLPISIEWSPIQSPSFFVTDEHNLKELMADLFASKEAAAFFYSSPLVQGFYYYFATEVLHVLEKQKFTSPLTPRLGPDTDDIQDILGEQSCFVIDVSLSLNAKNYWGRVILSENFRRDWKSYFALLGPPPLSEEMRQKVMGDLSLEVAHARMKLEEWKEVKTGDFVLLDHCSYDPEEHKGGVVLTLKQKPVFRGRFKEGGIKITNYPVYEEVSDAMEEEPFSPEEEEEGEDLYGDVDKETELEEEEDLFEDLEVKEESLQEPSESPLKTELAPSEEGPSITAEELPIHLIVEVGRLRMTAQELMTLAPGNLLELKVSPEQGVDLVVNGKKVGRGELMRMGDVLGVRIISL